ncbi:MAG: TonB-dependent receptor [Acidobacteriia bacterium]|nr:TonB-dependent receptor [Terriglobia bacterium]
MRVRVILRVVLAIVIIVFAGTSVLFAQVSGSGAQLNGTVRDASGGVVAKASLEIRDTDTNRTYSATTTDVGFYVLPNLSPGHYELVATAPGFSKTTRTGIVLTVGQVATIDVELKVAATGENIEVASEEVPPVEPTRTEVSQVIDTKQIDSLPISGRLFTDFALLTPGVALGRTSLQSTITETEVTRISFGGMRDLSNLVTVDGADTINTATGSQRGTPSQEAVSEFRVVNNSFGTEQGRAMGGIVNIITKSGTNTLHGSLYGYLENSAMNARSMLQPAPLPNTLRQGQYGGTLGGPIRKDKTFFFANYEGQRRGEIPVQSPELVNNLALINAAKAILGIAPENVGVLKTADSDRGLIKIDQRISGANSLTLRYNVEDARDLNVLMGDTLDGGGIGAPSSAHNNFLRDQALVGTLTSILKSNLVNTVLVQYARRHSTFPGATGQPNLDLPNSLLMGHNFGVFDATYESRAQFSDSVSWVKGSHVAKFGVDFNYVNDHIIWPGFSPMRIVLPGINCLVDFANYVGSKKGIPSSQYLTSNFVEGPCPLALPPTGNPGLNTPPSPFPAAPGPNPADLENGTPVVFWPSPLGSADNSVVNGMIPPPVNTNWQSAYPAAATPNYFSDINHSYYGLFFQDQWRVNSKFTLNYGLRWDLEKGLEQEINTRYTGFQPRVGIAYSPDKHTVIRAGFGIFDDRYNLSFFFVTHPQRAVTFCMNASCSQTYPLPGVRDGGLNATYSLSQLPYIPGSPFGIEPADAAANLIRFGTYQPVQMVTNLFTGTVSPVGDGAVARDSKIPYSEQGSLEIDREIGHGLVLNLAYMFVSAHHQVRAENLNVCPPGGATTGPFPCAPAPPTLPGFAAGKSNFSGVLIPVGLLYYTDNSGNSVYHGLTFSATERAGQYFRLNANYTFSKTLDDGTFTTFVSTPQDLYHRASERANSNQDIRNRFVGNFTATGPQKSFLRNTELSGIVTLDGARPFTMFVGFDANGDTNPVTDRVGNAPRNSYWGDTLKSVDIRLSQHFNFLERQRIEFAVDVFNMFNRPNVNEVTSVYGTYNFCSGAAPVRYKDAGSIAIQTGKSSCWAAGVGGSPVGLAAGPPEPSPIFGAARTMFNPRQFQFSLKYTF